MSHTHEVVLREMMMYAHAYRYSWLGFDGRDLLGQLSGINAWARDGGPGDFTDGSDFFFQRVAETLGVDRAIEILREAGGTPSAEAIERERRRA
jgi:hypothetical protein